MKLKVSEVIGASLVFGSPKYSEAETDMNVAMWIVRNVKALGEVYDVFEKQRVALFEKYTISTEGKKEIPKEKMPEYKEEIKTILDEEVEVDIVMISKEALNSLRVRPIDLSSIMFAISE